MRLVGILLFVSAAWGGETAIFASGARMHVDRHEAVNASTLRLYTAGGFAELPAAQILGFEPDDALPAPGPAAADAGGAAAGQPVSSFPLSAREMADRAADKYGLPRQLVRSVMAAESGFAPQAVSAKGAVGLMQLMPSTAGELGVDARDPWQNVDAGTRYLRDLLVRYDGALWHALAAYNAGPGAVDKYGSIPPYRETIEYINRIDHDVWKRGAMLP